MNIKFIENIADNAEHILNDDNVTEMNVEVFKYGFLPYFTGEKHNPNLLAKWVEVAGGINKPVKLIDADGNVVDELPPIMASSISDSNDIQDLNTVINKAELQNKHFVGSGDRVLKESLDATLTDTSSVIGKMTNEWRLVIDKYSDNTKDAPTEIDDLDGVEIEY